jgi:methylmalonyl-CoA mutase cobalamin-binding domain/chain
VYPADLERHSIPLKLVGKMVDDDGQLDLGTLSDSDLVKQMHDDLYDGFKEESVEGVNILLERGWTPYDVLTKALVEGMRIVGIDFRDGILFVPEVLLAANAMKAGMAVLRPLLAETGAPTVGKMIIGTVKGDIHDIGKNLVAMMMEGAGFEVINLGINNPVENYLKAIDEHAPDILGMSALLTTTMPYMKVVIDALVEKGIRNDYVVLVGGAPLNEQFANAIGADAYCRDASLAVETAKAFMAKRQGSAAAKMSSTTDIKPDGSEVIAVKDIDGVRIMECGPSLTHKVSSARINKDGATAA